MKHEEQHLDIDQDGKLKGLWDIDVKKVKGGDIWDKIQAVIEAYAQVHSMEMEITIRENAKLTETRKNALASTEGGSRLRWGANVPAGLMFKLEMLEPELFIDKKKFHKFIKKYKGFRVCKTV